MTRTQSAHHVVRSTRQGRLWRIRCRCGLVFTAGTHSAAVERYVAHLEARP